MRLTAPLRSEIVVAIMISKCLDRVVTYEEGGIYGQRVFICVVGSKLSERQHSCKSLSTITLFIVH